LGSVVSMDKDEMQSHFRTAFEEVRQGREPVREDLSGVDVDDDLPTLGGGQSTSLVCRPSGL
jgi:hypothetical protein